MCDMFSGHSTTEYCFKCQRGMRHVGSLAIKYEGHFFCPDCQKTMKVCIATFMYRHLGSSLLKPCVNFIVGVYENPLCRATEKRTRRR